VINLFNQYYYLQLLLYITFWIQVQGWNQPCWIGLCIHLFFFLYKNPSQNSCKSRNVEWKWEVKAIKSLAIPMNNRWGKVRFLLEPNEQMTVLRSSLVWQSHGRRATLCLFYRIVFVPHTSRLYYITEEDHRPLLYSSCAKDELPLLMMMRRKTEIGCFLAIVVFVLLCCSSSFSLSLVLYNSCLPDMLFPNLWSRSRTTTNYWLHYYYFWLTPICLLWSVSQSSQSGWLVVLHTLMFSKYKYFNNCPALTWVASPHSLSPTTSSTPKT
jgi:hypothetical protein